MQIYNPNNRKESSMNNDIQNGVLCFIDVRRVCRTEEGYLFLLSKDIHENIDKISKDLSIVSYFKSSSKTDKWTGDTIYESNLMVPIIRLGSIYVLLTNSICENHMPILEKNLMDYYDTDGRHVTFIDFHDILEVPTSCIDDEGRDSYIKLLEVKEYYEKLDFINKSLDKFINSL